MHSHTRRGFLAQTLGAGFLSASLLEQAFFRASLALAQAPLAPTDTFEIEKVADGAYAAIARGAAITNCNAAIFENARDLLIVDTHSKPSAVAAMVAQLRKHVTPKPVRYVVETHFHWDHTQGAGGYRRIAPDAELISSTATRSLIAEFGARAIARIRRGIACGTGQLSAPARLGANAGRKSAFRENDCGRAYMAQMRDYQPELPDVTFSENLVLHDKAHELHLAFRGRGHTAGDVVVFCPQAKVLATGDLLHSWLPYIADGFPREWPGTLRTVRGFEFEHVIGGHGGVQHSRQRLDQFAGYIEELTEAVDAGKRKGLTVEQLQSTITPASLKSLGGGYGEFVGGQITHYDGQQELNEPADVVAGSVKGISTACLTGVSRWGC
jgi:glyoxylase-like metal-dependent hydrolase (beta-lactamase superfamily II)